MFSLIDAHHHFWDPTQNLYPWMREGTLPNHRYGDTSSLIRPYLPRDYEADTAGFDVLGTVYIEAEWDPQDSLGEMAYIASLRNQGPGFPTAAVAHARLNESDVLRSLEKLAEFGFVRGVRHKPHATPAPGCGPGGMADTAWIQGYGAMAYLGLHFELQTPWWHLHEAAHVARRFPDTTIVVNHAGLPTDRSEGGLKAWREALKAVAQYPNVAIKLSGLGQAGGHWCMASNRRIVLEAIDIFRPDRCMFASNFPVDELCAPFSTIFNGFSTIVADFSEVERSAMFVGNACRIYRL